MANLNTPSSYQPVFKGTFTGLIIQNNETASLFANASPTSGMKLGNPTNNVLGYFNGCIITQANGDGTGAYAGLIAGAWYNWDSASTDTGQKEVNQLCILFDERLEQSIFPQTSIKPNDPNFIGSVNYDPTSTYTQYLVSLASNIINPDFLYGPNNPATDKVAVQTLLATLASAGKISIQNGKQRPSGTFGSQVTF